MPIDSLITVLSTTSPILSHPSTRIWHETYMSIRHHLPEAQVILLMDDIHPQKESMRANYQMFKERIGRMQEDYKFGVLEFTGWAHQTGMLASAIHAVHTPLVLWIDHDLPLLPYPIDWQGIADTIFSGQFGGIRFFMQGAGGDPSCGMISRSGVPLSPTTQWLGWPTVFSIEMLHAFAREYGHLKAYLGGISETDGFPRAHEQDFPYAVYCPFDGPSIARCYHTNGNADMPKDYIEIDGKRRYTDDGRGPVV